MVVIIWRYSTVTQGAPWQYCTVTQEALWRYCTITQEAPWQYCRKTIIQNSFYGELIMYSCSTALQNTLHYSTIVQYKLFVQRPHTFCVICFCYLMLTSRLFEFFFVQLLRTISFVKYISRNKVCAICCVQFAFCLFCAIYFVNVFCAICFLLVLCNLLRHF